MDVIVALSLITFALHFGATFTMLAMARAPGWERLRLVALIAATAGAYSFVNAISMSMDRTLESVRLVNAINLTVAAAHISTWIWYTFADDTGRWSTIPRRLQALAVVNFAVAASVALSGRFAKDEPMRVVDVPSLGVAFGVPQVSAVANVSMAILILSLAICLWEYVRRYRAGLPGMGAQLVGFVVFFACSAEEALVTAGLIDFVFIAELGFLAMVLPVALQMIERLVGDAQRLQVLTAALSQEIDLAHEERDSARDALAAQERFAALGRMAGGVGHEINNPLQILTLSLDELRGAPGVAGEAATADIVEHAVIASDRIRQIVAGLRTYAPPGETVLERLSPQELVHQAISASRAEVPGLPDVRLDLVDAPEVLVDRTRMLHALGHAIANSARAVAEVPDGGGRVELRTRRTSSGDVLIEVRDNGAGFPASVLTRLGEPFVTTQPPGAGSGLGIFIIRGVVAAHGGMLELENARGGGAVLRILLPPAA